MPLPRDDAPWPPPELREALNLYKVYGAWYSGDPVELTKVYSNMPGLDGVGGELPVGQPHAPRFWAGIAQGVQRMFWGTSSNPAQVRGHKLHAPLAGDIATTSANQLFGESVKDKVGKPPPKAKEGEATASNPTQERLDDIKLEANVDAVWLEAAEIAAAFGGSFPRIKWDPVVADCPLFDVVPPDAAVPTFRGDWLDSVIFWRNLTNYEGDRKVWRHLELHERGNIVHALYRSGDEHKIGRRMNLVDHPETKSFADLVDGSSGAIATGYKGLTADYLPNIRPNRALRGSPLGRSDYHGPVMQFMDAYDEAWTSWMRDLRLGKGRLIAPRAYLQSRGKGQGSFFDAEREVWEAVDALTGPDSGMMIQVVQFSIRVDEHERTCKAAFAEAVKGAGYDEAAFGQADTMAMTATEVQARMQRTNNTRKTKQMYSRGPRRRLTAGLLAVDAAKFGTQGLDLSEPVMVEWPDAVAVDPEAQARTLQMLAGAESASIRTRVGMLNKDWHPDEIDREVIRIKEDMQAAQPQPVAPPGAANAGGHGPNFGPPTGPSGDDGPAAQTKPAGGVDGGL